MKPSRLFQIYCELNPKSTWTKRRRGAMEAAHRLELACVASLFIFGLTFAAVPSTPTPQSESAKRSEDYETLLKRIRTEPLTDLSDPMFPALLISGERHGGVLMLTTSLHDPMNPSTLDKNFADWNLAARASLLLAYAQLVTMPDTPRPYVGIPDDMHRAFDANDAADRARIHQIAKASGYLESWKPFEVAYRRFAESAAKTLPPGDTAESDTTTPGIVARIAREQGLFRLVRELPFDPLDVTNEMLRLVSTTRALMGSPSGVSDDGPNLLYACGWDPVTVHIHSWHRLAPAFFQAAASADAKTGDAHALVIMRTYDEISSDIKTWSAKHPNAGTVDRDRVVNEMAKTRGLFTLLEK